MLPLIFCFHTATLGNKRRKQWALLVEEGYRNVHVSITSIHDVLDPGPEKAMSVPCGVKIPPGRIPNTRAFGTPRGPIGRVKVSRGGLKHHG